MKLCKHVEYDWDEYGVTVTKGAAVPIFGWSREAEGDVPLLRCSHCDETAALSGVMVVYVNRGAWHDRKAVDPAEDEMAWDEIDTDTEEDEDVQWE